MPTIIINRNGCVADFLLCFKKDLLINNKQQNRTSQGNCDFPIATCHLPPTQSLYSRVPCVTLKKRSATLNWSCRTPQMTNAKWNCNFPHVRHTQLSLCQLTRGQWMCHLERSQCARTKVDLIFWKQSDMQTTTQFDIWLALCEHVFGVLIDRTIDSAPINSRLLVSTCCTWAHVGQL